MSPWFPSTVKKQKQKQNKTKHPTQN
jgi:hypothetical protein